MNTLSGELIPSKCMALIVIEGSNYWTHQGGLREVISVLPSKDQADMSVLHRFSFAPPITVIQSPEGVRNITMPMRQLYWALLLLLH